MNLLPDFACLLSQLKCKKIGANSKRLTAKDGAGSESDRFQKGAALSF